MEPTTSMKQLYSLRMAPETYTFRKNMRKVKINVDMHTINPYFKSYRPFHLFHLHCLRTMLFGLMELGSTDLFIIRCAGSAYSGIISSWSSVASNHNCLVLHSICRWPKLTLIRSRRHSCFSSWMLIKILSAVFGSRKVNFVAIVGDAPNLYMGRFYSLATAGWRELWKYIYMYTQ